MKKTSQILLGMVISCSVLLLAATPEWIQYNERVVGENSPYYTDVVNRPSKQIWANFTSQHDVNGAHRASIFPTAIPTAIFPTPLPTATPGPDFPTPLPTATPGPDFPTPLPTATPIPSNRLYNNLSDEITVGTLPYTISAANGSQGTMYNITGAGALTLPSAADCTTYGCHTVRIFVAQNANATSVSASSGYIYTLGNLSATTLTSSTTPQGSYLELWYSSDLLRWFVVSMIGTWTPTQ